MRQFVFWIFILTITAALGGSAAYGLRPWFDAANVLNGIASQPLPTNVSRPTVTPLPRPTMIASMPSPTPSPTRVPIINPDGQTNYLLMASDTDAKFAGNIAPDTQVMIFVSYDAKHNQVYVISIPRDLYVPIPGYGIDKIYTAPEYGDLGLAVQTVESNFNVKIDHYAWVGLKGFIKIIDSLGGIDLNVAHPIVENDFPDDLDPLGNAYGYRRFFIPPGPQHLDGVNALLYVRARHADLIGDFGRSQRQQQVLLQIKQKLKDADIFSVGPSLIQDMKGEKGEFRTDLTPAQLFGLAHSLLGLKASSIHRWVLTSYATAEKKTVNGVEEDILNPNWDRINPLFQCVLSPAAATTACAGL